MIPKQNLNRLAYFVAVVEEGSITAAAERVGVSKAVVSKQLQLLEQEVGTPLVLRDTRKMQPTDAGRNFFEAARIAVAQADRAFNEVMDRDRTPKGRLRVTAPVDYGLAQVAPLIARFGARFPKVSFDLHLSDEKTDIVRDRFDIAFRVGWLEDSSHLARKLQDFEEFIVASPETATGHKITAPEDLRALPLVASQAIAGDRKWRFARDDEIREVTLSSASTMNITLAIQDAIENWTAYTILPDFLLEGALAAGRLVRLLPDWRIRTGGVYMLTTSTTVRSSAVKQFLKMAQADLAK